MNIARVLSKRRNRWALLLGLALMFMLLPAAALVCRSWLMLTAVPLAYVLTRLRIGREQRYLEKRFGREYADYRRRTGLLLPKWPRRDEPKH